MFISIQSNFFFTHQEFYKNKPSNGFSFHSVDQLKDVSLQYPPSFHRYYPSQFYNSLMNGFDHFYSDLVSSGGR